MTLKDVVLAALEKVSEEEILEILGVEPGSSDEDAAKKLEQRRKTDRERQARHRANKAGKKAADPEPESEDEDVEGAPEEDYASAYEDKTAVELFKLCKARKMTTVLPKKPQRFYIDLLVEQDKKEAAAKAKEAEDEADGGDWGDEDDQEDEKPVKKNRGRGAKSSAKPAKEAEPDDEGEWDI